MKLGNPAPTILSLHFYPIFILPLFISVSYHNKREKTKAYETLKTCFQLLGLNNFTQEFLDLQKNNSLFHY